MNYEHQAVNAVDNTPQAVAREEGEATEAARRSPMTAGGAITSDVHEAARRYAKLVFNGARDAGMTSKELDAMKKRMAKWVNVVTAHARDRRQLDASDMPEQLRESMRRDMLRSREESFREIFA